MQRPLLESSQVDKMNLEPLKAVWTKRLSLSKHEHTPSNIVSCKCTLNMFSRQYYKLLPCK